MPPRRRSRNGPVPLRTRVAPPEGRHAIVKRIMQTHNLNMINASKHVKKHKLYKGGKLPMQYVRTRSGGSFSIMRDLAPKNLLTNAFKGANNLIDKGISAVASDPVGAMQAFNAFRRVR